MSVFHGAMHGGLGGKNVLLKIDLWQSAAPECVRETYATIFS